MVEAGAIVDKLQQRPMTLTRERILSTILTFVADSFCDGRRDGLDAGTGLVTSGIVDSAGVVHVVEFLEGRFAIHIADDEVGLAAFNTLAAMTELVAGKLGLPAASDQADGPSRTSASRPRRRRAR